MKMTSDDHKDNIASRRPHYRPRACPRVEKHDYFFGAHDVNRVQFSMGRSITLNPPQQGQPLNYFVFPYVEVDGKEFSNALTKNSFAGVSTGTAVASR